LCEKKIGTGVLLYHDDLMIAHAAVPGGDYLNISGGDGARSNIEVYNHAIHTGET